MGCRLMLATSCLTLALSSCSDDPSTLPPLGYHLVTLDTDARVPSALGTKADPAAPPPLFDRLEVAVLFEDETEPRAENVRDFDIDEDTFRGEGATFTIAREDEGTASEAGPRVRARLYRQASVVEGRLQPETVVDLWSQLPPTPETGAAETTIYLLTEDVGTTQGNSTAPLSVSDGPEARVRPGRLETSLVGSWAGAQVVDCAEPVRSGRVCVPGGAYWMGNPLVRGDGFTDSDQQRLVVLSPFYLDPREVTVGELRSWLDTQPEGPLDVIERSPDPGVPAHFCTFTRAPTDADDRPVNCVSWETAQRYCNDQGGALPTESQFEYVSGALRSALHIWGTDEAAICQAAVWGRAGRTGTAIADVGSSACLDLAEASLDGPVALRTDTLGDSRVTDKIDLPGGTVYDVAGNLQEWQSDYYAGQDGSCWKRSDGNLFYDPVCTDVGVTGERSVRGGSWVQGRVFLRAAYRTRRSTADAMQYDVGFRCAASDE
jgi:formylglycine-generating enzyme required for sulfatase activity